jgi:hypothetical protein
MLDQLIRKHIQRYLNESKQLSEDNVNINTLNINTLSGWNFEIPSADSIRGQRAQKIAVANGAFTGLSIIATRRSYRLFGYNSKNEKTFNDAELDNDAKKMFGAIADRDFPGKYDPGKTLFVYFKAVDKKYKKIWNVWAFDKQETGINDIVKQWKTALQKSTYFTQSELEINRVQSISLMSYSQAEKWFSSLEKAKRDFKIDTKTKLPNLSAIKTADDSDDDTLKSQKVRIDIDGNVFDSKGNRIDIDSYGFADGEAEIMVAPDSESVIIKPIRGTIGIIDLESRRSGIFKGEFKNGAPFKGNITYDSFSDNEIETFEGEVSSEIETVNNKQYFIFDKIKGRATYGDGFIFDGEFKNNMRWNGKVFNNKNQAIGQIVQGKFELGLKYPFEWNANNLTFKVYNDGDKVYFNSINSNDIWAETSKDKFENEIYLTNSIKDFGVKQIDSWQKVVNLFIKFEGKIPDTDLFKQLLIRIVKSPVDLYKKTGSEFKLAVREQPVDLSISAQTDYSYKKQETSKGIIYYLITIDSEELWISEKFINIIGPKAEDGVE